MGVNFNRKNFDRTFGSGITESPIDIGAWGLGLSINTTPDLTTHTPPCRIYPYSYNKILIYEMGVRTNFVRKNRAFGSNRGMEARSIYSTPRLATLTRLAEVIP